MIYEDFSNRSEAQPVFPSSAQADAASPDALDVYEQGYKAGWDDATANQLSDAEKRVVDVCQALSDNQFTYLEAEQSVLSSFEPLLRDIVGAILPSLARDALEVQIIEVVKTIVGDARGDRCTISVAAEDRDAVITTLSEALPSNVEILGDPKLVSGQATVSYRAEQRNVDLSTAEKSIAALMDAYLADGAIEERSHA